MDENEVKRGKNGLPIPGPGRPLGSKTDPLKKARKQLIEEYKDALAEALPLINPVLVKKAQEGDIQAIKEINDIVVDKAIRKTDLTSNGQTIIPILGGNALPTDNSSKEDIKP